MAIKLNKGQENEVDNQSIIKEKLGNIINELKGLSVWQAFHVLECAKEELSEWVEEKSNSIIFS